MAFLLGSCAGRAAPRRAGKGKAIDGAASNRLWTSVWDEAGCVDSKLLQCDPADDA